MTTKLELKNIRFYTPLDPYYYTTDNRPLEDLAARDEQLARAIDLVTGGSERASMAAASIAQSLIGNDKYAGAYTLPGGLVIRFDYGFGVMLITDSKNPALRFPRMGVHDSVTSITEIRAASTPGRALKYMVQAKFEEPDENSRIPSSGSDTKVCTLTLKTSSEFVNDGNSEPTIIPDVGAIPVLETVVPYGKTTLTEDDIRRLSFTPVDAIQQIVSNGPVNPTDIKISRRTHEATLAKGEQYVDLSAQDCPIKLADGTDNIEVYITGLYQHTFTAEVAQNRIKLGGALPSSGEVLVVQLMPVPKA